MGNEEESEQMSSQVVRRVNESSAAVAALRKNVDSGELVLDPQAGAALRDALGDQRDQVDKWLARADDLARHAPLGQNPVAEAMATKFAKRTSGEDDSFMAVLRRYREVLDDAHDAVGAAMQEYRNLEENASETFRSLQR